MIINKNMYKYTAIISLTIVIILIGNLILPAVTMAEEKNTHGILNDIQYNEADNTMSITGTVPSGFNEYKLYWSIGDMPVEELPADATVEQKDKKIENAINWSNEAGHLLTDVIQSSNSKIESTIRIPDNISKETTYNALCVVTAEDGSRMMHIVKKTLGAKQIIENTTNIHLDVEGNKVNINVKDSVYDIKTIKFVKADRPMSINDFEGVKEKLDFKVAKDVSITQEVKVSGIYYVYAETTVGTKSMNACIVSEIANNDEPEEELATEEMQEESGKQEPSEEKTNKKEPSKEEPSEEKTNKEESSKEAPSEEKTNKEESSKETPSEEKTNKEESSKETPSEEKTNEGEPSREEPSKEQPEREGVSKEDKEQQEKNENQKNVEEIIQVKVTTNNEEKDTAKDEYVSLEDMTVVKNESTNSTQESNNKTNKNEDQNNKDKSTEDVKDKADKNEKNGNNTTNTIGKSDVTDTQRSDKAIPQTGSDNTLVITAIIIFTAISAICFVKVQDCRRVKLTKSAKKYNIIKKKIMKGVK